MEDMFLYHIRVGGGGHITAFTVPVSVGDVEVGVVVCVESVHGAQLSKLAKNSRRVFEMFCWVWCQEGKWWSATWV